MSDSTIFQSYRNDCRILKISAKDDCNFFVESSIPGEMTLNERLCKAGPNHVFRIGGMKNSKEISDCLRYDLISKKWLNMPKLQQAR